MFKLILSILMSLLLNTGYVGKNDPGFNDLFANHFKKITTEVIDNYGVDSTSMWLSSWELSTDLYPFNFSHTDSIPCRVYLDRSVDAPAGSTLYWSLPDIAAAVELSHQLGDLTFEKSAKRFVKDYLKRCTSNNGIILWGNHYYYDVLLDKPVKFKSSETPQIVNFQKESGDLHELRPLLPPWELLYSWFPDEIDKHIRQTSEMHIVDIETGEFNRHANQQSEYAFLEAGSIIVNSLAFLYSKTKDESLLELADLIVNYSFNNRNTETGLVINSPSMNRWDQYTSTTEIGLWSLNILKASVYVPEAVSNTWTQIAKDALEPWLNRGFDEQMGMYYGALNVNTGEPIEKTSNYPYQPQTYADIWNPLFPTHNYPMYFAECTLLLWKMTGNEKYQTGSKRWYRTVRNQLPGTIYSGSIYAENYARIIHFLINYARIFEDNSARELAIELANGAVSNLYVKQAKMFRSHTKEMRYDCVDGIGLLFFAIDGINNHVSSDLSKSFF